MAQDTRKDPRAKVLSLNVRYKSATIDEFIEHHSHDISKGGIFIKTPSPFPSGTLLKFEIRIKEDQPIIGGVGRVVWRREPPQASGEKPAGMGVKFIKLDGDKSRELIDRIVRDRKTEGPSFEETADGAPPPSTASPAAAASPARGPSPSFFPPDGNAPPPQAPPQERTVIRQANEILEDALKSAGLGIGATGATTGSEPISLVAPQKASPSPVPPAKSPTTPPAPAAAAAPAAADEDDLPAAPPPAAAKKSPRKATMMGLGLEDAAADGGLHPDIAAAIAEVTKNGAGKDDSSSPLEARGKEVASSGAPPKPDTKIEAKSDAKAEKKIDAPTAPSPERSAAKKAVDSPAAPRVDASSRVTASDPPSARAADAPRETVPRSSGALMWGLVALLLIGAAAGGYSLLNKGGAGSTPAAGSVSPVVIPQGPAPTPSAVAPAASIAPTAAPTMAPTAPASVAPTASVVPAPTVAPAPIAPAPIAPPTPAVVPTHVAPPTPTVAPKPYVAPPSDTPPVAPKPKPKPKAADDNPYGE